MLNFSRVLFVAASIAMVGSTAQANLLINSGFEAPDLGTLPNLGPNNYTGIPSNYAYPGYYAPSTFNSWTYNGGAGLINTASDPNAWYSPTPILGYGGVQYAFVQGNGILSQTFNSGAAGSTSISWLAGGRPFFGCCNGDQSYDVYLNTTLLGTFSTSSFQNFTPTSATGVLNLGSNTLYFKGLSAADNTAFVDNVNVSAIPEASTWAMMLVGFAGVGFVAYRRKARSTLRLA